MLNVSGPTFTTQKPPNPNTTCLGLAYTDPVGRGGGGKGVNVGQYDRSMQCLGHVRGHLFAVPVCVLQAIPIHRSGVPAEKRACSGMSDPVA